MNAHHSSPDDATKRVYDAVIVGAGLAGSTMAAWLASQGWRVLLAERDHFPRHKSCGEFLSPEAQSALAALGLYDDIRDLNPLPLHRVQLTAATGMSLEMQLPGDAWGISRYALDAALAAAAEQRGAELWTGTTVTKWHANEQGMCVQLRQRQAATSAAPDEGQHTTVQTRAVLLACGRHGFTTLLPDPASHPAHKPARATSVGIKCHFTNLAMPAQVELYLFAGGYVGINPVEEGRVNVCALASYATFGRAGRSPTALLDAAAQWNPTFGQRIGGAQAMPETECAVAPVDTLRTPQAWAGLPLLGDTAAMIAPLCGDGMAMALRSAELCAPLVDGYLRAAYSWQELGARYHQLWQQEFAQRLRIGRILEAMLQRPRTAHRLLQVGARLPFLADYLARITRGPVTRPTLEAHLLR